MASAGERLEAMRGRAPLVQCITNYVAMQRAADALLAIGASPAMVHDAREAGGFAGIADALTINIGTLSPHWVEGMEAAATGARGPWVLDPVAVGATAFRRETAARLMALKPTAVRGNASEILALSGEAGAGRGADAGDPVEAAESAARALAARSGAVVAVTGETDFVTDGTRAARLTGGSVLMTKATAVGCALTGIAGAFLAGEDDPFEGVIAALASFKAAGAHAAEGADGPGSFMPRFMDALAALDAAAVDGRTARAAA